MRKIIPALACLALSGCSLSFTRPIRVEHQVVELASGVLYEDEMTGVGEAAQLGDELEVHYQAWLEDGQLVDSSVDRGIPIRFVLGEAPIAGWNEALVGMSAGGTRLLTVPPELAYGTEGIPGLVPPDAPLSFEIELVSIIDPEADETDDADEAGDTDDAAPPSDPDAGEAAD